MNKIIFWVAFAVSGFGFAADADAMKSAIFLSIGLAVGLWVYPLLERWR
jgi:hypothetical protein